MNRSSRYESVSSHKRAGRSINKRQGRKSRGHRTDAPGAPATGALAVGACRRRCRPRPFTAIGVDGAAFVLPHGSGAARSSALAEESPGPVAVGIYSGSVVLPEACEPVPGLGEEPCGLNGERACNAYL